MKRFVPFLLAAVVLVGTAFQSHPAHAALTSLAQGAGNGNMQKDSVGGQSVQELYDRAISWTLPASYSATSSTSGVPFSITQSAAYTTAYKGPWYLRIYNTGINTVVATPLTYSAAYTVDLTAVGIQAALNSGAVNGVVTVGPLSPSDFAHLRGVSATATGKYQLGTHNR